MHHKTSDRLVQNKQANKVRWYWYYYTIILLYYYIIEPATILVQKNSCSNLFLSLTTVNSWTYFHFASWSHKYIRCRYALSLSG